MSADSLSAPPPMSGVRQPQYYAPAHPNPFAYPAITTAPAAPAAPGGPMVDNGGSERKISVDELGLRNYVLLIDKSGSMNVEDCSGVSRWEAMKEGLIAFVSKITTLDKDGVEVYFFNDKLSQGQTKSGSTGFTSEEEVVDLFSKVSPDNGTWLATPLETLIEKHYFKDSARPLTILVITDGAAADGEAAKRVIIKAANRLKALSHPACRLAISFIQIGQDKAAAKFLQDLDDGLRNRTSEDPSVFCPYDIVDTVNMTDVARRGGLTKVLLEAVND